MVLSEEEQDGCLLLPDHDAEWGAGELVRLAELVLQVLEVCGGDVFWMADKHGEDRWFGGHLGDKGRLGNGRRLVFASR